MPIDQEHLVAAGLVGAGLALAVSGVLLRVQRRSATLAELLELTGGEADIPVEVVTESPEAPSVSRVTARLGDILGHLDSRGSIGAALARGDIPLRSGEYLFLAGASGAVAAALVGYVTASLVAAVAVIVVVGLAAWRYPVRRARKRQDRLRSQLPDAFSLMASAVASGHTFLRALQQLREQVPAPLSAELDRVVAEVMLGSNLIDALEGMSRRCQIDDLRWAVQAVRIQQSTGGQLAELLHTLAEFMRARQEVYREVAVLTAEGRFSAYVLMALPVLVTLALEVTSPHYLRPFFRGWGFVFLGVCVGLLAVGFVVIRRMADIEV